MDLFDRTKLRLDSKATPSGLRDLCCLGVLASKRYLRALSLIKDNAYWNRVLFNALLLLAAWFAVFGTAVFFQENWSSFRFFNKMVLTQLAFVFSVVLAFFCGTDRIIGRVFLVAAMADTGFMLFLIDRHYPTFDDSWVIFVQWFALMILWVLCCRSSLVWIIGLGIANCSAILWGYQAGIPNGVIEWQHLLMLLCLANFVLLMFIEVMADVFLKKSKSYLWAVSLAVTLSIGLFLAGYRVFMAEFLSIEILYFVAMSAFLCWFYYIRCPRYLALVLIGGWLTLFILTLFLKLTVGAVEMKFATLSMSMAVSAGLFALEILGVVSVFSWIILLLHRRKDRGLLR